jgi:type II secretory pathway pseudopilin PulG
VLRRTRARLAEPEDGLGLIEVMIAILILGVAMSALASVGLASLGSTRVSRDREQATNAASAAIEAARSRDFALLAMAPGSVAVSSIPPTVLPPGSTATCFGSEPVVTDAVPDPVPFRQVGGNQGRITVHTVVTFAEGTCALGASPAVRSDLKRVTAIASWTDGGVVRTVRNETLVAAVGRGLPVPEFKVRPPDASLQVSQAFLADGAVSDRRRCVEHQLRNLGSEDSYEWELQAVSSGSVVPFGNGYRGGDWLITGHLESPALPVGRSGQPPPGTGDLMLPSGGRPASDERIQPGGIATLTFCYEPAAGTVVPWAGTWPAAVITTIAVHSRFDDRVLEVVSHRITTVDESAPGTPLRLFDPNDSMAHRRSGTAANGSATYVPYVMGPQALPGSDPSLVNHLGTIDYRDVTRSNWSSESPGAHPGVHLRRATAGEHREVGAATLVWHHQFLAPTVLLPDATLLLWHAPTSAFTGTLPPGGQAVRLEIRVDGFKKNEKTVEWAGISTSYDYVHTVARTETSSGWTRLEIPLHLGGEVALESSQYFRLRVTCSPVNGSDCNLAYDNWYHPSGIFIRVKS